MFNYFSPKNKGLSAFTSEAFMLNYWLEDIELRNFVYDQFIKNDKGFGGIPIHIFEFNNAITRKATSTLVSYSSWCQFGRATFSESQQKEIIAQLKAFRNHIKLKPLNFFESKSVVPPTMLVHYDGAEIKTEMFFTKFLESKNHA